MAALWIGLVVGVPTWYLAGSLVELGMAWWQGLLTVLCGNLLVLFPMVLNGHPGCKYGLPFPVLARASFGIRGSVIPSLLRALVACGWFSIQTWIGATSIHGFLSHLLQPLLSSPPLSSLLTTLSSLLPSSTLSLLHSSLLSLSLSLGISISQFLCFLGFWAAQVAIVWRGVDSIRVLESASAPVLSLLCLTLLVWAVTNAGGFGPMLSAPSQFGPGGAREGQFWLVFFPSLTANVGFWATLSLNIADFTRFATSQADQLMGQALGLPLSMLLFSFLGLAVTSATVTIFGPPPISDPVALLAKIPGLLPSLLACFGICLATVTTNIAANVVAPANALLALAPASLSFPVAATLSASVALFLRPWQLVASPDGFVLTWLVGYSALLGPVAGVLLADYFLLRSRELDVDALYSLDPAGKYWYSHGYNPAAVAATIVGVLPNLPGFLAAIHVLRGVPAWASLLYSNSWVVGCVVSAVAYMGLMRVQGNGRVAGMVEGVEE